MPTPRVHKPSSRRIWTSSARCLQGDEQFLWVLRKREKSEASGEETQEESLALTSDVQSEKEIERHLPYQNTDTDKEEKKEDLVSSNSDVQSEKEIERHLPYQNTDTDKEEKKEDLVSSNSDAQSEKESEREFLYQNLAEGEGFHLDRMRCGTTDLTEDPKPALADFCCREVDPVSSLPFSCDGGFSVSGLCLVRRLPKRALWFSPP